MSLQGIRLLETTQPAAASSRLPSSPTRSKHAPSASHSSSKKYEPWNDMHFSVDGVIATTTGIGGLPSLPTPTTQQGPGDTSAIAPWMTDDIPDLLSPAPPPKRALFSSSKSSLVPLQISPTSTRGRGASEASTSYALAANGVNGTPLVVGSEFGDAWRLPNATRDHNLPPTSYYNDRGSPEGKDYKRSFMGRGKDFGRMLKKKASKVSIGKRDGSDEGHPPPVQPIPPLPYPNPSTSTLNGSTLNFSTVGLPERALPPTPSSPTSATAPKEKKRKMTAGFANIVKIPKPSRSTTTGTQEVGNLELTPAGSFPPHHHAYGADPDTEPTLTLDTNLEEMDGIIDLNKAALNNNFVRPLHEGLQGQSATTTNTSTALEGWDVLDGGGASSSLGTSENGAALGLGAAWTDPFAAASSKVTVDPGSVPKSPTSVDPGFKRAFDPGHGRTPSSTVLGKRKSLLPPLDKIRSAGGESKDPAWHAPESWDVDKVGPEAGDYSSDEEIGRSGPKSLDHHQLPHRSENYNSPGLVDRDGDFGIIEHHRPSSASASTTRPRIKGANNAFNGIGMIGGIGGGAYGIGVVGYGRLRTKSDALSGGGSVGGPDGMFGPGLSRKPSWPDGDESLSRRPSDALSSSTGPKTPLPSFHLRVYRIDGTYHIVECPVGTTSHDLSHVLRKKLLLPGQNYKLHLRERGRERVLGQFEKPINILRRRLEQAGYDESDDLEHLGGDDLTFLLRFVFRDANLTAAQASGEEDLFTNTSSSFENIDLTGRGLLTIPIALHKHAATIVVLNLSKNPHIDLPLDFINDCVMLRDLRLSHAAMKQVPSRVRSITTLHGLDISCNRMVSLDEADLHKIPELRNVQVQNNRLSSLPKSFAEMRSIKFLNISNNKFDTIPEVLSSMRSLVELDVSFNTVSVFPAHLGALVNLERLVIVGNRIEAVPTDIGKMRKLKELDCRRNLITDISPVFLCPALEVLQAENNLLHGVQLRAGSKLRVLKVSGNERLSSFSVETPTEKDPPFALEVIELSKCMLSSLNDAALAQLKCLTSLKFDHNTIRAIPDGVCQLPGLEYLSGSNNHLDALPNSIGNLTRLKSLQMHNNNIKIVPASIWHCSSLVEFNASSNLLSDWQDAPVDALSSTIPEDPKHSKRPPGTAQSNSGKTLSPLSLSLERLYLADNRLDYDVFHSLSHLRSLKILNLSFNDIYDLPPLRLPMFAQVRELYLSGNKLTSLPGEDLHRLHHLRVLFLNANKLQTLPSELTKVTTLESLDVGNNVLKYNIANWQFDWNWNFNRELRYLNLSGNKRLEIKNSQTHDTTRNTRDRAPLTDFSELPQLRLLGLMDVTLSVNESVPDETDERRIRTSPSEINGMAYGIADTLGMVDGFDKSNNLKLSMFDLVVPSFRGSDNESLFGMFGRHTPFQSGNRPASNRLTRFLQRKFTRTFTEALKGLRPEDGETVSDALRRAFLSLNKGFYETSKTPDDPLSGKRPSTLGVHSPATVDLKSAASGLVVYIVNEPKQRMMYVAHVGNTSAVVARRQANPIQVTNSHDPFDRNETARIRLAEGWVSPKGTVNDELEISRSFGVFHLLPAVNARPDVATFPLTEQDEFVIIGNRGLWDYVSPQTAVDIARLNKADPMIAAQRLRDYAMSYGAQGSTMIMVIAVGDLYHPRVQNPAMDVVDSDLKRLAPRRADQTIGDRTLARLEIEIPPPTGQIAIVFTDIRNSTSLWEKNEGMPTAMRLHNSLLRRHLRDIGGYEVKTEGDAFMVSFKSISAALLWALTVQVQLLQEEWPLLILESEDGREIVDSEGAVLARGLSVRMGIHWGAPACEPDPVTGRMDYFGTMVNRTARVNNSAKGGCIMMTQDVLREILAILPMDDSKPGFLSSLDNVPLHKGAGPNAEAIQRMGIVIKDIGEQRLKGLETAEHLAALYPKALAGRIRLETEESVAQASVVSRVRLDVEQVRALAMIAIRIETLASERIFRSTATLYRNQSLQAPTPDMTTPGPLEDLTHPIYMYANPDLLMPTIRENATDEDLVQIMDSLATRIGNAVASLYLRKVGGYHPVLAALEQATKIDSSMLAQALALFGSLMEDDE